MEMGTPRLAVRDLGRSLAFYRRVLGLEVVQDLGDAVVLTGGLSLQTLESWAALLGRPAAEVAFGGAAGELSFTAEDFDAVLKALESVPDLELVHPPLERRWGQRAVRLYDPDRHLLEVAEPLAQVCRRFRDSGLSEEGVARRMAVTVEFVRQQLEAR